MLTYPNIDPVALSIGPLQIYWYAIAYLAGFLFAWGYARLLSAKYLGVRPNKDDIDDFISWAILGVLIGGRLGYVLFYNLPFYSDNPLEALKLWNGGMSFHGGVIGLVSAIIIFALKNKINMFRLADIASCAAPMGFFFGRIANFVNGELYGRVVTDTENVPWAMVFPHAGPEPRHPSQLYEAVLEGLVLFTILFIASRFQAVRERPGILSAIFLIGYATFRFIVEFFRQPDAQIGFLIGGLSMGQLLSLAMVLGGCLLVLLMKIGVTKRSP